MERCGRNLWEMKAAGQRQRDSAVTACTEPATTMNVKRQCHLPDEILLLLAESTWSDACQAAVAAICVWLTRYICMGREIWSVDTENKQWQCPTSIIPSLSR